MPTKEQKIEDLLNALDNYAQDNNSHPGLPTWGTYHVAKMRAIVQSYLDNLEEENKNPAWNENQQAAYRAFLVAGIPDEWAKAMADRVNNSEWRSSDTGADCYLWSFTSWSDTDEGVGFWYSVANAVEADGVSAFSRFKCP